MKKFVAILLLAMTASTAMAQHHGHPGYQIQRHVHRGHFHNGWVAPLVIGGTIGYVLNRPGPVVVEQSPVYVQPTVVQPQCTRYIYQDQNGQTIREEIRCSQ